MGGKVIHLREDRDNLGEPTSWCDAFTFDCAETPENTNCRECLEVVAKFAAQCAERLAELVKEPISSTIEEG